MYGENGTRLRQGLTELLRHHRIQQQLGGAGAPMTARTSPEERAKLGLLIRTYRHSVVVWCHQTAHAVDPYTVSNVARGPANPFAETGRELGPLDALKRSLDAVRARSPARLPTLEELTTPPQRFLRRVTRDGTAPRWAVAQALLVAPPLVGIDDLVAAVVAASS